MKQIICSKCNGMGYFIVYYGDTDQDPRRIPCHHDGEVTKVVQNESITTENVASGFVKEESSHSALIDQ